MQAQHHQSTQHKFTYTNWNEEEEAKVKLYNMVLVGGCTIRSIVFTLVWFCFGLGLGTTFCEGIRITFLSVQLSM